MLFLPHSHPNLLRTKHLYESDTVGTHYSNRILYYKCYTSIQNDYPSDRLGFRKSCLMVGSFIKYQEYWMTKYMNKYCNRCLKDYPILKGGIDDND